MCVWVNLLLENTCSVKSKASLKFHCQAPKDVLNLTGKPSWTFYLCVHTWRDERLWIITHPVRRRWLLLANGGKGINYKRLPFDFFPQRRTGCDLLSKNCLGEIVLSGVEKKKKNINSLFSNLDTQPVEGFWTQKVFGVCKTKFPLADDKVEVWVWDVTVHLTTSGGS